MTGRTYVCGRCGDERPAMRLPDDWPESTVAAWLRLEERFLCDACEALVNAYAAEVLAQEETE